jgi:uncharacterized MnhB-related membrane protein
MSTSTAMQIISHWFYVPCVITLPSMAASLSLGLVGALSAPDRAMTEGPVGVGAQGAAFETWAEVWQAAYEAIQ